MALALNVFKTVTKIATTNPVGIYTAPVGYSGVVLLAQATNIATALPQNGGVPIQENETDARNGGIVVYTSTDQSGNFRIGDGVVINQQTGTIAGTFYSKSLFSTMTPFILALGGD